MGIQISSRGMRTSLCLFFVCCGFFLAQFRLQAQTRESRDGKTYITHKVQAKETYYQLSRLYRVPVNAIMKANKQRNLRVGDVVRIPTGGRSADDPVQNGDTVAVRNAAGKIIPVSADHILTEYKVGTNETLYAISRRFQTTVEDVKILNGLDSDVVREGLLLKIPSGPLPEPEAAEVIPVLRDSAEAVPVIPTRQIDGSRYGLRETSEKGIGVWMENLETKNNSNLALHKTAPIGTILKITNPISKSVTYAKVVGKFADNSDTHDAIVVVSRSAAAYIGAVDKRFLIEITYGLPLE